MATEPVELAPPVENMKPGSQKWWVDDYSLDFERVWLEDYLGKF